MRSLLFPIASALLLAEFAAASHAQQLRWESEEVNLTPIPTDAEAVAHFKFKNVGAQEAQITAVNSRCSCTTPTLEKKRFTPGESGEVKVVFTIGSKTGLQEKTVTVENNDPKRPYTTLRIKVAIPEVVQLRPTFLYWSPSEPLTPKETSIKIMNGFPAKVVTVESSNTLISTRVETVKPGQEYRLIVMPGETVQPAVAKLTIKTDYPPENPKTFFVHVRVDARK